MSFRKEVKLCICFVIISAIFLAIFFFIRPHGSDSYRKTPNPISNSEPSIGLLGRTPVRIPYKYARLIEYDESSASKRSIDSSTIRDTEYPKIRTFGFLLKFPSIVKEESISPKPANNGNSYSSVHVIVLSNEYYGDFDTMEREVGSLIKSEFNQFKFALQPKTIFGMEVYYPMDPSQRRERSIGIVDLQDYNIYVERNEDHLARTYITCLNGAISSGTCTMRFLIPEPMKSRVTVRFSADLLHSWESVRLSTCNLIKSFKITNVN